ncbi:MAG TPA: hypothetical protein VJU16_00410 [Planctomycetota bacterium]|nr:hypothetical protein [Planctomycetota bacterium]
MLKTAPDSRAERPVLGRYFFVDPIRIAAMACAIALMAVQVVPLWLVIASIALSQANGIAMVVGIIGRGWSLRWGRRGREAVLASTLASDWTNTSVCTLVGAMLLLRMYGPPEMVLALGLLALGIGLLPDVRFCRALLSNDLGTASRTLSEGYFFRDPVKLGGLIALLILCTLDEVSLTFIFMSMGLLQLNSVMILIDKYMTELDRGGNAVVFRNPAIRMFLARDGQRLLIMMLPFFFVPFRLAVSASDARWVAGAVAALIIIPDLLRGSFRSIEAVRGPKAGLVSAPPVDAR